MPLNKNRKSKNHHWILHIRLNLGIKFYFKQTMLNFGAKFVSLTITTTITFYL